MRSILPSKAIGFVLLVALLIIVNAFVISEYAIAASRVVRFASAILLFSYYLANRGIKNALIFIGILAWTARDIFLLNYELPLNKTICFVLSIVSYMSFAIHIFKQVKIKLSVSLITLFALSLIGLNVMNVYLLSNTLDKMLDNDFQWILFLLQSVAIICLSCMGFVFNERHVGPQPLLFLYGSMSVLLGDLSGLAAYFYELDVAYFAERILYILAYALFVQYGLQLKKLKGKLESVPVRNDFF